MWEILGGLLIIGVGLLRHESVFLGQITVLSVVFDCIAVAAIITGLVKLRRQRAASPPLR